MLGLFLVYEPAADTLNVSHSLFLRRPLSCNELEVDCAKCGLYYAPCQIRRFLF